MVAKIPTSGKGLSQRSNSCGGLVAYLEKEVQGQWFSLDREDVPAAEVVATLDKNKRNLNRAADKYYQVVLAPSQAELRHIDSDLEKLRAYTRAAMEQYAANFGKGIEGRDLVYFAKVEHERTTNYQDRAVQLGNVAEGQAKPGPQTHIHIIVSRTENLARYIERKKSGEVERKNPYHLSPLTNHKDTHRGVVTGGFERKQYSERVEQAFDQAFVYKRPLVETFRYVHTMQHGTIEDCAALRVQAIQEQQQAEQEQQRQVEQEQQSKAEQTRQAEALEAAAQEQWQVAAQLVVQREEAERQAAQLDQRQEAERQAAQRQELERQAAVVQAAKVPELPAVERKWQAAYQQYSAEIDRQNSQHQTFNRLIDSYSEHLKLHPNEEGIAAVQRVIAGDPHTAQLQADLARQVAAQAYYVQQREKSFDQRPALKKQAQGNFFGKTKASREAEEKLEYLKDPTKPPPDLLQPALLEFARAAKDAQYAPAIGIEARTYYLPEVVGLSLAEYAAKQEAQRQVMVRISQPASEIKPTGSAEILQRTLTKAGAQVSMQHTTDPQGNRVSEVVVQYNVQQPRSEVKEISLVLDWATKQPRHAVQEREADRTQRQAFGQQDTQREQARSQEPRRSRQQGIG